MRTQFDHSIRVVSLDNLYAMCERISGMAHRYSVSKVSRSRVHVEYSNPDEYGRSRPVTAIYPTWPSTFGANDNPSVALDALRVSDPDNTWGGEAWQCFEELRECPVLWRSPDEHDKACVHVNEPYAPRVDAMCAGLSCTPGEWQSHGDSLANGVTRGLSTFEDCARGHGRHCDAPMRAAQALAEFHRTLIGYCACNAQLRALDRHEKSCPMFVPGYNSASANRLREVTRRMPLIPNDESAR